MLKLICSDVDGTLVPDGGHDLNPEYFTQIRHLKKMAFFCRRIRPFLFQPEKIVCTGN